MLKDLFQRMSMSNEGGEPQRKSSAFRILRGSLNSQHHQRNENGALEGTSGKAFTTLGLQQAEISRLQSHRPVVLNENGNKLKQDDGSTPRKLNSTHNLADSHEGANEVKNLRQSLGSHEVAVGKKRISVIKDRARLRDLIKNIQSNQGIIESRHLKPENPLNSMN